MEQAILKDKIILIVDDYIINTEFLSLFVRGTGAIALTASNGLECIEIIKNRHVDMILMDGNMPVLDGIEATKAVRALPQGNNVVIVGFSGSDEKEKAEAGILAGMNLVVEKLSLNEAKLLEIAERFFGASEDSARPYAPLTVPADEKDAVSIDDGTSQSVIDYERALHEFENDNDLLVSLIIDFNGIIHSQRIAMLQALDKSDYEYIRRESHGITGGAANICAAPLSEAAKALESACRRHAEKETVAELLDKFFRAVDSFDHFVEEQIVKTSRSSLHPTVE